MHEPSTEKSDYQRGWEGAIAAIRKEISGLDLLAMMRAQPNVAVEERNTHDRPRPIHVVALDQVWLALDVHAKAPLGTTPADALRPAGGLR